MAAVAIAGIGMMMVCSSSLAAVMLMGGEEETPTTTTSAQSAAGPTGDEDDDTGDEDDDSGGSGNGVVWETETSESAKYKKLVAGTLLENVRGNTMICKAECIANENCTGFNIKKTGTSECDLYSGDDLNWNSSDRHKGYKFNRTLFEESRNSGDEGNINPFLNPSSSSGGCSGMQKLMNKC
jgi:hypothetical protein